MAVPQLPQTLVVQGKQREGQAAADAAQHAGAHAWTKGPGRRGRREGARSPARAPSGATLPPPSRHLYHVGRAAERGLGLCGLVPVGLAPDLAQLVLQAATAVAVAGLRQPWGFRELIQAGGTPQPALDYRARLGAWERCKDGTVSHCSSRDNQKVDL